MLYFEDGRTNDEANILGQDQSSKSEETFDTLTVKHSTNHKYNIYKEERAVFTPSEEFNWKDFNMNSRYLIMYNDERVAKLELTRIDDTEPQIEQLKLHVDNRDPQHHCIFKVHVTNNQDMIVIVIKRNEKQYMVLTWDLSLDYEMQSFDIEKPFMVQMDEDGHAYVLHNGLVSFFNENCELNLYQYDKADLQRLWDQDVLNKSNTLAYGNLNHARGHRVDAVNHNWVLFDDYLALPFSYMSFVIKDHFERKLIGLKQNVFDPEPYSYLFNKSTVFMDGSFVQDDDRQLRYVLHNLQKLDHNYLSILLYYKVLERESESRKIARKKFEELIVSMNQSTTARKTNCCGCVRQR